MSKGANRKLRALEEEVGLVSRPAAQISASVRPSFQSWEAKGRHQGNLIISSWPPKAQRYTGVSRVGWQGGRGGPLEHSEVGVLLLS